MVDGNTKNTNENTQNTNENTQNTDENTQIQMKTLKIQTKTLKIRMKTLRKKLAENAVRKRVEIIQLKTLFSLMKITKFYLGTVPKSSLTEEGGSLVAFLLVIFKIP